MAREIYIETAQLGDTIRVTAIDSETGQEASAIGPKNAARADLEKIALGKLRRALGLVDDPPPAPRPGKLV